MVDPPRELAALEVQQHRDGKRVSVSIDSCYSSPQVPAPLYHGAPCPATSEISRTRRPLSSHRRLPIPPVQVSHSPSASTSSSSLSLPTQLSTSRRQSVFVLLGFAVTLTSSLCSSYRPLPKRPESPPEHLETRNHRASMDEQWSPMSPAHSLVPQRPTDIEVVRHRNLSKLRRHLGDSVPSDLVAPRANGDGASDGPKVDGEEPKVVPTEEKKRKDEKLVTRWLREKKGRRWAEDNYGTIIQSLREL